MHIILNIKIEYINLINKEDLHENQIKNYQDAKLHL